MRIWRLIEDIPRTGNFNMAADQFLLENYSQDAYPVFRIYDWESTTLSLGRNEILDHQIDLNACEKFGIPIVRRSTGGKAVLHGFDLTYSIVGGVLDQQFPGGVLDNYKYLAKGFYAFFQKLGLNPELKELDQHKNYSKTHICFADPAVFEILVEGRKIIGNAQRVKILHTSDTTSCRVFLQHGSIPIKDSIPMLIKIFPHVAEKNLRREMHSLETTGVYPRLSKNNIRQLFLDSLQEVFQLKWERQCWKIDELELISERENYFQNLNIM